MKGAPLLVTLLAAALVAGTSLYHRKHQAKPPAEPSGTPDSPAAFVAGQLGIAPRDPSPLQTTSPDTLRDRIGTNLDARFGPGGLAHRTRAYELLTLLPSGQNLHGQLVAMQAAGTRAWFDDLQGEILVVEGFDPITRPDDRATLIRLRTQELLFREGFTLPSDASDDEWIAHRTLHQALGDALQLADQLDAPPSLPTSEETEREAILLSFPHYIHNLALGRELIGIPFLKQRREATPTPWIELLRSAPGHTHGLLHTSPDPLPDLPRTGSTLLEESLGAWSTQLLLERHSDYERAEALTPHWRGDHYRLFSNGRGDHLVWNCLWENPESANRAADILRNALSLDGSVPGTNERQFQVTTRGNLLLVFNCSDLATLATLQK